MQMDAEQRQIEDLFDGATYLDFLNRVEKTDAASLRISEASGLLNQINN